MFNVKGKSGHSQSLETRARISATRTGRHWEHKGHPVSAETRERISITMKEKTGSLNGRWRGGKQVSSRKHDAKRRTLGFISLNKPFGGSEGHHIDIERVIYVPKELHQSIRHNVRTGKNMAIINAIAYGYL